ncbi:acyl-CoA thioesterase [Ferruginibacter sp. SUN106]|uniref:acyl-CoA thioesterase n=1 Tax=Ferruginibacter sp. SUN106 TaxID=2978348 RepID=UPI003D3636FD
MARIKLEMPENTIAVITIPVRITDINYGNHLGNDAFVAIIHEARMQWLYRHGYTELNIEGTGLILADLVVEFKNESFYGDIIEVSISVGEISKVSFELFYKLSTTRDEKNILLAQAKTGMVCYDYAIRKVASIPEKLKSIL